MAGFREKIGQKNFCEIESEGGTKVRRARTTTNVVAYYRSECTKNGFEYASEATNLQRESIAAWADGLGYKVIGEFVDRYNPGDGPKFELPGLMSALEKCRATAAALVCLPFIKQWRPNIHMDARIEEFRECGGKIIEIRREEAESLYELFALRASEKNADRIRRKIELRQKRGQDLGRYRRRIASLEHQREMHPLILEFIEMGLPDSEAIQRLNMIGRFTVQQKPWKPTNYRKLRQVVATADFLAKSAKEIAKLSTAAGVLEIRLKPRSGRAEN